MDRSSQFILQNIFNCYKRQLFEMPLALKHRKAVNAITQCRTAAMGVSAYECDDKHNLTLIAHSCRHRSCSICASRRRHQWVEAQQSRLLNCPHFQCVFTLPSEYHVLWQFNQKWFTSTFFDVVRSTLMDLLKDESGHGITPGVFMAMHTWGRQLNLHPHIHCVVTGGGLKANGEWHSTGKFLLPARQARALYRGRFQAKIKEAYASGELILPPDHTPATFRQIQKTTYDKVWCVRFEQQYAHGRGILKYLSRYLRGGPINPSQIVRCDSKQIGFRYKDHRDKRKKVLNLKPQEFIRRILLHVPETGQHTVRHYGLYAGASRKRRNACRELLGGLIESLPNNEQSQGLELACRCCGSKLRLKWSVHPHREKAISYKESFNERHVQQADEPDIGQGKKKITALRL